VREPAAALSRTATPARPDWHAAGEVRAKARVGRPSSAPSGVSLVSLRPERMVVRPQARASRAISSPVLPLAPYILRVMNAC
jgi:hypothetical protein